MTPIRSADELTPGQTFDLGCFTLQEAEVLDFARRYDPQPFHLDHAAGAASIFGGLVASGLNTLAAAFGHLMRSGLLGDTNLGGNAMEVKWPAPLKPGQEVALRVVVEELRHSRSRPDMAIGKLRYLLTRVEDGVLVLDVLITHFIRR